MQPCSHAAIQLCSHAVIQPCSHAAMQPFNHSRLEEFPAFAAFAAFRVTAVMKLSQSLTVLSISISIPMLMLIVALQPYSHAAMQSCSHSATLGLESSQPLQPPETFESHYSNGDASADHTYAYAYTHAYYSYAVIESSQPLQSS